MPMSLMNILVACENQLGWIPEGADQIKAKAVMHHIMTKAMKRQGVSVEDLALTLAYCRLRRQPISSPLQLLPLVTTARSAATVINRPRALDVRTQDARDWETTRDDADTPYWLGRLVRSVGPARADTLDEWAAAGRGIDPKGT
jgi:hypothetical protein